MCGIAGVFHFDSNRKVNKDILKSMSDIISYRGPDAEGFFIDKNVGLAHRRLSIIDLSSGAQPMYSDDNQLALVFNGEIYNYIELEGELKALGHRFKTSSDTEVIIRAYEQWGIDCQQKFNGMWAFALWDNRKKQLFISRDRLGEKPLNYGIFDNSLLFSSEIKSIGKYGIPLSPNKELLELFLFLGYVPEPYTFYRGIKKLQAGHYLIVKDNQANEFKYWDLPEIDEKNLLVNENQVVDEFSQLFRDSIRIRMRSDVAYGAFLSGGLDSSSIVSQMSEISSQPVETFTIGFNEKKYDERAMANLVSKHFKTNHHEHIVNAGNFDKSLKNILFHYDEPFGDPAAIPTEIVSKYAAEKVKMVLTGDGADEVLAGYSTYVSENLSTTYQRFPRLIRTLAPKMLNAGAKYLTGNIRYKSNQAVRVLNNFNASFEDRLISKFIKMSSDSMKNLYGSISYPIEDFINDVFSNSNLKDPFYKLTYYNLKVSLPGQMLVKIDRMSMAHSLETRAPFLDHRIVEYMYRVDKRVKLPNAKSVKNVLQKSMASRLPNEIIHRKKKGFDVPLREWFKGDLFDDKLNQDYSRYGLNDYIIKELLAENKAAKSDHGTLIWRILIYTGWLNQF